jgi:hypothetical protein
MSTIWPGAHSRSFVGFMAGAGVALSFLRDRAVSLAQWRAGEAMTQPRRAVKLYEIQRETPSGQTLTLFSGSDPLRARQAWEFYQAEGQKGVLVFLENGAERGRH